MTLEWCSKHCTVYMYNWMTERWRYSKQRQYDWDPGRHEYLCTRAPCLQRRRLFIEIRALEHYWTQRTSSREARSIHSHDAIQEKKLLVRMKHNRSIKEQPLQEIRSHKRRNSGSDGDGRKTMQFELETNSSEAIVSSNSCVSIDGNLIQTSVLSGGSDSIHSKKTMRRRDRAPTESVVM